MARVSRYPIVSKAASSMHCKTYIGMNAGSDSAKNTECHGNLYFWLAEVYRYRVDVRANIGLVTRGDSTHSNFSPLYLLVALLVEHDPAPF